jgi:hypothetical protein
MVIQIKPTSNKLIERLKNTTKVLVTWNFLGGNMPEQRSYARDINIPAIVQALKDHFMPQGFQTQAIGNPPHVIFQMAKSGTLASVTGTARAMTVQFNQKSDETVVSIGEQKWLDKAAVGAVGALILWPLLFTAAYGAIKQSTLPTEIWQVIDSVAYSLMAATQQPIAPMYAPAPIMPTAPAPDLPPPPQQAAPFEGAAQGSKFCPDCGAKSTGTKFCPNCGKQLY